MKTSNILMYNIEDRRKSADPVGKRKYAKLAPDSPFPVLPDADGVLISSGAVPHWRHALAVKKAVETGRYTAVGIYDPILNGAVIIHSQTDACAVGSVIPV